MTGNDRKTIVRDVRRVVLKLGTRMLTNGPYSLDMEALARLAMDIADLRKKGYEIVVVSSGAIAAGMGRMGIHRRPTSIPELQALAAIGQSLLMNAYEKVLGMMDIPIGQVLLTIDDIHDRKRYVNAMNTLDELIRMGVVPIINENDSVATHEVNVGDNDNLSAYVASIVDADLLVLFTDVDGLRDRHPKDGVGTVIPLVEEVTPEIEALCGDPGDKAAIGGMRTKIEASKHVLVAGGMMIIANGRKMRLSRILEGDGAGTLFRGRERGLNARRHWIAMTAKVRGAILVDRGAAKAIEEKNASLLPKGITGVRKTFDIGDVVAINGPENVEIARGVALYSSADIKRIKGRHSNEIDGILGYTNGTTVVHRNNMVRRSNGFKTPD